MLNHQTSCDDLSDGLADLTLEVWVGVVLVAGLAVAVLEAKSTNHITRTHTHTHQEKIELSNHMNSSSITGNPFNLIS